MRLYGSQEAICTPLVGRASLYLPPAGRCMSCTGHVYVSVYGYRCQNGTGYLNIGYSGYSI